MGRRPHVLGVVLAGGQGARLWPLTRDRAKPAVPFAGDYRLIDFALSNLVNGGYVRIAVLTQYKSHSLDMHLAKTWRLSATLGNYVAPVPAQQREGARWFEGSADAIYQNLNVIADERPDYICVFGADHVYKMDPSQMVEAHIESGCDVTVAGIRVPRDEAFRFGVIEPGPDDTIAAFHEKPADAAGLPDDPSRVFASMGNYVFSTKALVDAVVADHGSKGSDHDMGGNVITSMVSNGSAAVYDFNANDVPGSTDRDRAYWRDVGTIESYFDAHRDLISADPVFNLYNRRWPVHTWHESLPPAKFVHDDDDRRGVAVNSMVSNGAIISGGTVRNSVLSPGCVVHSYVEVEDAILLHGVQVGRGAKVRRAIVDKDVRIPEGARIGMDPAFDREHFHVSDSGIVVIGKGDTVPLP